MPYIRVYLPKASIEQKRTIAQELIEITLRTFHLRNHDRYRVSVEFVSIFRARACQLPYPSISTSPDLLLEVMGHDLTEATKRAFAKEAGLILAQFVRTNPKNRVAYLLGIRPPTPPQIAVEFGELNPAVSEPFVVHPRSRAA